MQKLYAQIELSDGTEHTLRVLLADKILASKTAAIHKWDIQGKNEIDYSAVMAYSAAKRAGLTESTFNDFLDNDLIDLFMSNEEPEGIEETNPPF